MDRKTRNAIGIPRAAKKNMEKAILAAKNPKDSKFGECLININTKEDPVLNSKLEKIRSEMKRMKLQVNQVKEKFMRRSQVLNYEPMILVERPPSRLKNYQTLETSDVTTEEIEDYAKPGYMRRLRRRCKTPTRMVTIDAFTKRVSKKKNIWEDTEENKTPSFTSSIRPYSRLTDNEIGSLKDGCNYHKPSYSEDSSGKPSVTISNTF